MIVRLGLEWGGYPLWELTEDGFIIDNVLAKDLGLSIELSAKIDKLNDLYHSLFINNAKEFAYIGGELPEVEEEVTKLQAEIADEIRAELKESDELVEVWHFYTAAEMEVEEAKRKQKEKHTVNNNVRLRVMSSDFNIHSPEGQALVHHKKEE